MSPDTWSRWDLFTTAFAYCAVALGVAGWITIIRYWRELKKGARIIERCPRCDGMREFGHQCPDAIVCR